MRSALACVALAAIVACVGCGGKSAPPVSKPAGPPLHLAPSVDLAPAAGLTWLVDVEPRALRASSGLLPAIETAFPKESRALFAERNGGVDPTEMEEIVVAVYAEATLYFVRGVVDPSALETTFRARAESVDGRGVDREGDDPIVRTWGTVHGERQQLATFGRAAVALEMGRFGPLRAAEMFAEGRLKRASPALKAAPLDHAAALLRGAGPDAPVRAFASGPFEGASAHAMGGLLAGCTSVAASARPSATKDGALDVTILLVGGSFQDRAALAKERALATWDRVASSPTGRLLALDHPATQPYVETSQDGLTFRVTLDALAMARGARAMTSAQITEIMSY